MVNNVLFPAALLGIVVALLPVVMLAWSKVRVDHYGPQGLMSVRETPEGRKAYQRLMRRNAYLLAALTLFMLYHAWQDFVVQVPA